MTCIKQYHCCVFNITDNYTMHVKGRIAVFKESATGQGLISALVLNQTLTLNVPYLAKNCEINPLTATFSDALHSAGENPFYQISHAI